MTEQVKEISFVGCLRNAWKIDLFILYSDVVDTYMKWLFTRNLYGIVKKEHFLNSNPW